MTKLKEQTIQYIKATDATTHYYELAPTKARATRAVPKWESSTVPQLANITDQQIQVRDGAFINIRIYKPSLDEKLPIVVYYHGGGWVFGDLQSADAGCQLLAAKAQAIVISVDYRLAPEYKFPTPLHDAYDALLWAAGHANELGGDPTNISVAGDSAGGNLATVVTILAQQQNGPKLHAQALIYPVTNLDFTTSSYDTYGQHYGLDKTGMEWFSQHYADKEEHFNPLISPLQTTDLHGLPKTLIIAAEADVLFDEGIAYANRLKEQDVFTSHITLNGLVHSYFSKMDYFETATIETVDLIADFIK
ncbi:MAG: alpha/beta hydrolase [Lysinibacillus sp.]